MVDSTMAQGFLCKSIQFGIVSSIKFPVMPWGVSSHLLCLTPPLPLDLIKILKGLPFPRTALAMGDFKNLEKVDSSQLPSTCTTRDLKNNVLDLEVMEVI